MESVAVVPMDVHKKFSVATPMNAAAEVLETVRIEHGDAREMLAFFRRFPPETDVVLEATFGWPWVADAAQAAGLRPHLAHAWRAREMAKGFSKSDRQDARWGGRLWLAGEIFPEAYLAPPAVRRARGRFRLRLLLVRLRTALKNAVHGQLHQLGYVLDEAASDLFSPKGRAVLAGLPLAAEDRALLERKLAALDRLAGPIAELEAELQLELARDARAQLLLSLPGVGVLTAYAWLAEIGELGRFPNGRALAAYAGLLPLGWQSAGQEGARRTNRRCNRHLRYAALEAVGGAVRASPRLKSLYERVRAKNRKQPGKARVAVARELLELAHRLLTRGELYREIPPPRPGSERAREERRGEGSCEGSDGPEPRHPNRASPVRVSAGPARGQAES